MYDLTILFVLDKSGSMQSIVDDAIGGFNAFRRTQAAEPGRTALSLTLFDGKVHTAHPPLPIEEVADLTTRTYVPGGQTALYDAVGAAIETAQNTNADSKTLVAILTDGAENASHAYTRESLAALVAAKKQSGWDFVYLGAAQESWADAAALGMASAPFAPTPAGMATAYETVSSFARMTRSK